MRSQHEARDIFAIHRGKVKQLHIYIYAQDAASFLNRATPLYLVLSDLDIDDGVVMVYENQIRVLGWCTMYE